MQRAGPLVLLRAVIGSARKPSVIAATIVPDSRHADLAAERRELRGPIAPADCAIVSAGPRVVCYSADELDRSQRNRPAAAAARTAPVTTVAMVQ
jgi:hypothetical protein